ncbi:MAG: hypothetical protein EHM70_11310 [Chloroflexota bacterium]|nr:MAG: hypothetical protein EHM70_11310 [Chloroflexota bacterium]
MFLLQEGPADTLAYMIAGYAVIFGLMFAYLISLIVRAKNLKQDMEVLRQIEDKNTSGQKDPHVVSDYQ